MYKLTHPWSSVQIIVTASNTEFPYTVESRRYAPLQASETNFVHASIGQKFYGGYKLYML